MLDYESLVSLWCALDRKVVFVEIREKPSFEVTIPGWAAGVSPLQQTDVQIPPPR
jgi:hypothetical protein